MKIGIDLGTSYSSVAMIAKDKLEMVKLATGTCAFGDSYSMPTAVFVDKEGVLLGQAAFNKKIVDPSRFRSEFKRDLGTTTPYLLGGEGYLPEQLFTELFLYFKKQAVEQAGEEIDMAYITHPANYGNSKKLLLKKAAESAGLFNIDFVDEPTAAAIGYSQRNKISNGEILLVYDLGGGTFDVALIKKTTRGYIHMTEPMGISQCGGMDFDRVMLDDVINKLKESGRFDVERLLGEKRFIASLSETCIQIKHQLSQAEVHTQPIAVGFDYFDYVITRKEFEGLIAPLVGRTCEKIKDIIYSAGLTNSDIDKVLLVGGSSRVPLVREMVGNVLGKKIALDSDPELAICQGAVCAAFIQENEEEQKRLAREEEERLFKEGQERLAMEQKRRREEEQARINELERQLEEERQRRVKEQEQEKSSQKTGISFRLRDYSDFTQHNKPFIFKFNKLVILVDDRFELEIPPNPTQFIELDSGEHEIFMYMKNIGSKSCKTFHKVNLKKNEVCQIEIKIPAWGMEFKLYHNNKILN